MSMPAQPTRLALWIDKHGEPDQLKVEYRQTGTDTADTYITLTCSRSNKSIEVQPGDINERDRYGYKAGDDVCLNLSHATIVELTAGGRKRVDEWKAFQKREARDLAEFARLRRKFARKPAAPEAETMFEAYDPECIPGN